jgi:hypothetical protein
MNKGLWNNLSCRKHSGNKINLSWRELSSGVQAVSITETSIDVYETTLRNALEDSHLNTCTRENLKAHIILTDLSSTSLCKKI